MIFHYESVDFQDTRLTMEEWQDYKQSSCFLSIMNHSLALLGSRMGMLPELRVDNKFVLSQSHTISRFLATQFGWVFENFESA